MDWSKWESVTCKGEAASLSVAHLPGVPPMSLPRRCFPSHHIWRKRQLMASPSLTGTVVDLEIPSRPGDMEAGSLSGLGVLINFCGAPTCAPSGCTSQAPGDVCFDILATPPWPPGFQEHKVTWLSIGIPSLPRWFTGQVSEYTQAGSPTLPTSRTTSCSWTTDTCPVSLLSQSAA